MVKFFNSKGSFVFQVCETYFAKIILVIMGILSSSLIARALGPEGRGRYSVVLNISELAVQFMSIGLFAANVYFVSKKREYAKFAMGNSILASSLSGCLTFVLLLSGFGYYYEVTRSHILFKFLISIFVFLGMYNLLSANILYGLRDVSGVNKAEISSKTSHTVTLLILFLFGKVTLSILLLCLVLSYLVISCIQTYIIVLRHEIFPVLDQEFFFRSLKYSYKAFIATLFSFLLFKVDIFMVRSFLTEKETGIYAISLLMANLLYLLPATVGAVFFPTISSKECIQEKYNYIRNVSLKLFVAMFALSFLFLIPAKYLLLAFFGGDYLSSLLPFYILLPGFIFLAPSTIFQNGLASLENNMNIVVAPIFCFFINVILNSFLIEKFQLIGASIATSFSYLCYMLISYVLYESRFKREIRGQQGYC